VSKVGELRGLIDAAAENFGRLDIMVNNAGVETRTSVLDTTEEQFDKVLAINLKSAFFGTQPARQMTKQGRGCHIIITSVHKDWLLPGNTAYCLSNGDMRMLTRTAGVEQIVAASKQMSNSVLAGKGRCVIVDQCYEKNRGFGARHR